ncbi:Regulatory protein RecX [Alphaproteobacteria bacterium SO-S41]|nr:Regulatory protein RecX [Alphaproteobacteria bacterium SO-S41]
MRKLDLPSLKRSAAAYLGRYASSSANLRQVLLRRVRNWARLHPDTDISEKLPLVDEAVAFCVSAGLVDDASFAAGRTATLRQRGWPARRIRMALGIKGVPASLIDEALENDAGDDDAAALRFAARKRLGPWRGANREEKRHKDIATMARAGFSLSLARRTIDGEAD